MSYSINDRSLIEELCGRIRSEAISKCAELNKAPKTPDDDNVARFVHPLDDDITGASGILRKLLTGNEKCFSYAKAEVLDDLWLMLLDKAIRCLRYFDTREPFLENHNKMAVAYGLDNLEAYHKKYTEFEGLMYGANSYYRDHVFHAIRVWMLGVFCLLNKPNNGEPFINSIIMDGGAEPPRGINFFEYISMWTVASLCHDLGYPLEKAEQILDKTRKMMREFVPNPSVWNNFGYSGTQDSINEYILKFISTKMKKVPKTKLGSSKEEAIVLSSQTNCDNVTEEYNGRIQPKYYLKYAKSLENFQHGIISTIIVYKMLLYFLESDFNLNDDYIYKKEDAQQFYIRREILRAMAAHTCPDAYNVHITTFPSLLFICDEMQEWGRKTWNELYSGLNENSVTLKIEKFTHDEIVLDEAIDMSGIEDNDIVIRNVCQIFARQYVLYKTTFRDGQYTSERDFDLMKTMMLTLKDNGANTRLITIEYGLPKTAPSYFKVKLSEVGDAEEQALFADKIKAGIKKQPYSNDLQIN